MASYNIYTSPLEGRYASPELKALFSPRTRHSLWRELWLWLAEGERELGLDISEEAIKDLKGHLQVSDADFEVAAKEEARRRHDVMAHVHAFGQAAPSAAGIIHLGATSCYVTDGAEQILQRKAFELLLPKLAAVIKNLQDFALQYKDLPCLAYTHGQPAQPTTVGKRACLWIKDLLKDLLNLQRANDDIEFRGVKGTTGTQASFLDLFNGDHGKVEALDAFVTKKAGFAKSCAVTSQTYSRKQDLDVANAFTSLAASAHKIGGDLRHLAMMKEIEEPFEKDQIGSSAMAYKRNPMRSERACALARLLMQRSAGIANTFATQWLERSLDDSAARRADLPEMNLLADALLRVLDNVTAGLVVHPAVISRRLHEELPFMATESIIMALSRKGVSRQDAHEEIRKLSQEAGATVKDHGKENNLMYLIRKERFFKPVHDELEGMLDASRYIGRAPQQVEAFMPEVEAALAPYTEELEKRSKSVLNV